MLFTITLNLSGEIETEKSPTFLSPFFIKKCFSITEAPKVTAISQPRVPFE